jgi:Pyruvate/2-oxoacid:ferredoxin oxidoreductase gamma subunit
MIKKQKKEKSKIINKAQKTLNENNYSSHFINNNKVVVQIPKEELNGKLTSILTIGIMFALQKIGIKDLDITIKENQKNYDIIVEK